MTGEFQQDFITPPDPECLNEQRSDAAQAAVDAFLEANPTDDENVLCDLLCDLVHWADRNQQAGPFEWALQKAYMHYEAETAHPN